MTQPIVSRIAVIILAIVMIVFGVYHFMAPRTLMGYVPDFLPGGIIWVYFAGAAFILAAIAFITHKQVKLAGYLLALLLNRFCAYYPLAQLFKRRRHRYETGRIW